jgi:hypothetical protein
MRVYRTPSQEAGRVLFFASALYCSKSAEGLFNARMRCNVHGRQCRKEAEWIDPWASSMEHERQFLPIIRQFREERCVFRETRGFRMSTR